MEELEHEQYKTIGERRFKSTLYDLEYGYQVEELVFSVLGDTIGELFGVLDGAEGLTPADALGALGAGAGFQELTSSAGINGDALGRAIGGLFRRLRAHGGFFKFAKVILKNTRWIDKEEAKEIPYALMRGRYKDIEALVWWVLNHNFRAYFLERAAELTALSKKKSDESTQEGENASSKK